MIQRITFIALCMVMIPAQAQIDKNHHFINNPQNSYFSWSVNDGESLETVNKQMLIQKIERLHQAQQLEKPAKIPHLSQSAKIINEEMKPKPHLTVLSFSEPEKTKEYPMFPLLVTAYRIMVTAMRQLFSSSD